MINAQYKPGFLYSLVVLAILSLFFGVWALSVKQFPVAGIAILSALYLTTKFFATKRENLVLFADGFKYCGKSFNFSDIQSIKVLQQDSAVTPNLKLNPLRNSTIYDIEFKNETIQIVGKLYKNADKFMEALAKNAQVNIQSMKQL